MAINPAVVRYFEKRAIPETALIDFGIYSGRRLPSGEVVQDDLGEIIVFPNSRNGRTVAEKYREAHKKFSQKPGGERYFYNNEVLSDPQVTEKGMPVVIVEGEIDAISVHMAGYPFVVSVPDGAPPANSGQDDSNAITPEDDNKFQFIWNDWDRIKRVKRFVIAVDNDEPGKRLAEELVRRLGRNRCSFVIFPEGCKDFNDVWVNLDPVAARAVIDSAKEYPVSGVYGVDDLPKEPPLSPRSTGFRKLDNFLMPFYPGLMVVTGIAGSGKTSFVNQMVAQMALMHGWKAAIASFEMRVKPFVTGTLEATFLHHWGEKGTPEAAEEFVRRNFKFIAPEPSGDDDDFTVDWLIERAITAAVRDGIRVLVIDPWNEIEHGVGRRETVTDYTGKAIRSLKRFGREFECLVIVVAHPNKSAAVSKDCGEISLYDVADSAHFANKADFGVIIARVGGGDTDDNRTAVHVKKVRYQGVSGFPGTVELYFDRQKRIFYE